ncbi:hypothetical protein F4703DRAFT_1821501 [Phycomyces blakesleeanus]
MKFSIFASVSILAAVAHAKVRIISPDADTVWKAGESATIKWKSDGKDSSLTCDIQLLNGDPKDADIIGTLTKDGAPKCSENSFTVDSLDDYPSGTVFMRIGQNSKHKWSYSEDFKFKGDGSASSGSASSSSGSGSGSGSDSKPSGPSSSAPSKATPTDATSTQAPANNGGSGEATPTDSWLNTSPAATPTTPPQTESNTAESDEAASALSRFSSISSSVAAARATNQ